MVNTVSDAIDELDFAIGDLKKDLEWRDAIHSRVYAAVKDDIYFPISEDAWAQGAMDSADAVLRRTGGIEEICYNRRKAELFIRLFEADRAIAALQQQSNQ